MSPEPLLITRTRALARDLGRPIYAVVSDFLDVKIILFTSKQDLRNHGDSPRNPRHDYIAMANDVEGFIEEHKLKDTTLIGHSM
jgi:hypothetical protein